MDFVIFPAQQSNTQTFMSIARHLLAASSGVCLILLGSSSLLAQTPLSRDLISPKANTERSPQKQLSQAPAPSEAPPAPSANSLNPSGNPLNFPTKSSEVGITQRRAITLKQALELALQNNTQLQSSRLTLEQSQAALESARALLFPTIDTQFNLSRSASSSTDRSNAITIQQTQLQNFQRSQLGLPPQEPFLSSVNSTNATGNVQLTYNVYTGGERSAQIEKANKTVELNRLILDQTSAEVRFETTDRYYRLQNADAQVAIAQAAVEDTSQSLRDAQLLERAGLGTRFDTLRAEGDLATANQSLTSAISNQRIARRKLVEYLNLGQNVELTAADEIREAKPWPLEIEPTIVLAYKNRSELEQQLVQREISEQDSYIALSGIKPKLDLLASYDYTNNFDDSAGIGTGYSFQAQIRWRLFDGGRAFAEARRAYRQMDLANNNFAQQRNQIREQVEESYFSLISNQENITSTRKNVERFEEALRLARLRFQAGVGTQTDVINAQRDLTDARGRFLQAIIGYNQSLNSLQRAVSNLPESNLFKIH
jgi:OMF family outer membrane factor